MLLQRHINGSLYLQKAQCARSTSKTRLKKVDRYTYLLGVRWLLLRVAGAVNAGVEQHGLVLVDGRQLAVSTYHLEQEQRTFITTIPGQLS